MKQNNITLEITELIPELNIHDNSQNPTNTIFQNQLLNAQNAIEQQKDIKREQLSLRIKLIQRQKRLQRRKKLLVF